MNKIFQIIILFLLSLNLFAQPVPAVDENIPYLITFGAKSDKAWGDDDFCQIIFYSIPKNYTKPVYIRVYDPDISGDVDENNGNWNTRTKFSIYGGKGACSNEDARKINLSGNYKSGTLKTVKIFGPQPQYDKKWYTFGPFNPVEGEDLPEYGGNIFKVIIQGIAGDDGNLYRLFLSTKPDSNSPVEGAFAFYFKYKFRLYDDVNEVSHIYPYIDDKVIAIRQKNFDWDNDGIIRIISIAKNGEQLKVSGDNNWALSEHSVTDEERKTSYDIQFIKNKKEKIKNNNVVFKLSNQYGELLPFYSVPIGGIPKYQYSIGIEPILKNKKNND